MKIGAEFGKDYKSEKKVIFNYHELPNGSVPNGLVDFFKKNPGIIEVTVHFDLDWYAIYNRLEK